MGQDAKLKARIWAEFGCRGEVWYKVYTVSVCIWCQPRIYI